MKPNPVLCAAPWTHTYISPQHERRLCCASREPAQSFKQYIDTAVGTGVYNPMTLEQWWNSEHIRNVRVQMLAGTPPAECDVCNHKLLNTDVYRSYFNKMFAHKMDEIASCTDAEGFTTMRPVSWDYRFSNLCNFKCRMCGDMLSSSWETELKQNNMIDWSQSRNHWMLPDVREQISKFTDQQVVKEFTEAVENKSIEEIYWVGGEPLMWDIHWVSMSRIVQLGYAHRVYPRYNTNLSRVDYKKYNLFHLLSKFRDWQVCASIDGTGAIGEYIRTGLNYETWLENFKQGLKVAKHPRQLRLDLTLTLPGMFDIDNMVALADSLNVDILTKVCFAFDSDVLMSPMCLPRELLNQMLDKQLNRLSGTRHRSLIDVLQNMYNRPTFAEQWPSNYQPGASRGKRRILQMENIRPGYITMEQILSVDTDILKWWGDIECS